MYAHILADNVMRKVITRRLHCNRVAKSPFLSTVECVYGQIDCFKAKYLAEHISPTTLS
jgi:hypothetical protein